MVATFHPVVVIVKSSNPNVWLRLYGVIRVATAGRRRLSLICGDQPFPGRRASQSRSSRNPRLLWNVGFPGKSARVDGSPGSGRATLSGRHGCRLCRPQLQAGPDAT